MEFQDTAQMLGNIGEFVASIGVVITLIALLFQIRVNTAAVNEARKATTAQIYQARTDSRRRNLEWLISNETILGILDKISFSEVTGAEPSINPELLNELTPRELDLFRLFSEMGTLSLDNHVYQHQQGVLDEDFYESYTVPQIRAAIPMWNALGVDHTKRRMAFAEEVDRIAAG